MISMMTTKQRLTEELIVWTRALCNARTREQARTLAAEVSKIKDELNEVK